MISGMISGKILYQGYLWVLVTETMAFDVKWIASCLGSAIKKITFPLDTTNRVQVAMVSCNEISSDDCIQLRCSPKAALLLEDSQLVAEVRPDPLGQLGGKPIARLGVQCGKRWQKSSWFL